MGQVIDLRSTRTAHDEEMDTEPPAFESFFEEQKEPRFEHVVEAAASIVDSFEFHTG